MEHPLEKFAYCPICGSKHFVINNFKSKHCEDCGFTYYANPCAATAAFIVNNRNELLVVRRAKEPAKGTLRRLRQKASGSKSWNRNRAVPNAIS